MKAEPKDRISAPRLPSWFVALIGMLCLIPLGLTSVESAGHGVFDGGGIQTLFILWTSVWISIAIAGIGFVHYRVSRCQMVLVVAIAFLIAGFANVVESLILLSAILSHPNNAYSTVSERLAWWSAVGHGTSIMFSIIGLELTSGFRRGVALKVIIGLVIGLVAMAALMATNVIHHEIRPQDIDFVVRVLAIGPGFFLIRSLVIKEPSFFNQSLLLCFLPILLAEGQLVLSARGFLDVPAVLAQGLELVVFLTVFGGLLFDTMELKRSVWRRKDLIESESRLAAKCRELDLVEAERQNSRQEIERARDIAIRASQAKSEFLANMSHEIRTPLNAIIGMSDLLMETPLAIDQDQYVRISRRAGRTLLSIVNDILDLSRIESGDLKVTRVEFDCAKLIRSVGALMELRSKEKGLDLNFEVNLPPSQWLFGDVSRIRRILINVIGNAVKFTSQGSVFIRVDWLANDNERDHGNLRFIVRDTGVGIAQNVIPLIFDKFTQADSSVTRLHGGTGLGLAICQQLVLSLNGTITVASEVGRGSEFTVTLPMKAVERNGQIRTPPEVGERVPANSEEHQKKRVLLVEDSADNQALVKAYLKNEDIDLDIVADGLQAVGKVNTTSYDLVLMDMQMPVLDGYRATRRIRELETEKNWGRSPIVALTAHALNEEIKRCLDAGCDGHLAKPVRKQQLIEAINLFYRRPGGHDERNMARAH